MEPRERPSVLQRLHEWRVEHVSERMFMLLLALLVGFFAAVAAFSLHWIINQIVMLLTSSFEASRANWLYLVYPVIGIYLTSLFVRYIVKDDISHGITRILYAISSNKSRLKSHNCWSSVIASAITIGFGGSVGAEAPIVLTGSAIGSNLGQAFHMDRKMLMTLVGCGAAGAIAGIFKAPIAGLMFVIEVLMLDLTMKSLLPLLTTSITSVCVSYALYGTEAMFSFSLDHQFTIHVIPACIMLGVICGFLSLYFIRAMNWFEKVFARLKSGMNKFMLGVLVLGVLIYFMPALYGEGYDVISQLINNADPSEIMHNTIFYGNSANLLLYLSIVMMTKVFASAATNGGGGCGGVFAPSLFVGALGGFVFATLWNLMLSFTPGASYAMIPKNAVLYGMAGLMSGVMHAPLTGIFLIAELTGGYQLFVPIMIVAAVSYMTINVFEQHSIYAVRLARKGELLTHDKDNAILTLLNMTTLIERDHHALKPGWDLSKIVACIENSRRNIFPVVDDANVLVGVVSLDSLRKYIFRPELYHEYKVRSFMKEPPAILTVDDTVNVAMDKFDETRAWNLPVVDNSGVFVGFLSRSGLFSSYRRTLVDFTAE